MNMQVDPSSLPMPVIEAILERYRRRIRGSFVDWCGHALAPIGQAPAAPHRLMCEELQAVAEGRCDRLMLLLPPGHAKSTYASDLFPPWFLARRPRQNVIAASHTAGLAATFGQRARDRLTENGRVLGMGLADTGTAAADWRTDNGGTYYAIGVGGALAGRRADLIVADDLLPGRKEADSERLRETTWNWVRADLMTRLKPGGRIVLVMTRWHPADPAGRLLEEQPEGWRVLRLPAIAEDADDALGRAPGEPLWPDYYTAEFLAAKRAEVGEREWASLYQQRPRVLGGGLFKIAMLGTVEAQPAGLQLCRAWDLAATAQKGTNDPDWTVGALLGRDKDGRFTICDIVRFRGGPEEVERIIVATAQRDGGGVPISLPQDPGQAGKAQVLYLTRKLTGFRVESLRQTGDKASRAGPFASQVNVGNVSMVRAPWNRAVLDEMADFPASTHDDIVDALSEGFNALIPASGYTLNNVR